MMSTLYLIEPGSFLDVGEGKFCLAIRQQIDAKIGIDRVSQIVLFDRCNVSRKALGAIRSRGISVIFMGGQGRYLGRWGLHPPNERPYVIRQKQRSRDPEFSPSVARSLLQARLHNCCAFLLRMERTDSTFAVRKAIALLKRLMEDLPTVNSVEALWQYHAQTTSFYFPALRAAIAWVFNRPGWPPSASDRIASLLQLGYALLSHNLYVFIQARGLHPEWGHLHTACHNHLPLVCDLMEPFRAPMVEELVVDLFRRGCMTPDDFWPSKELGKLCLKPTALEAFVRHWEEKLQQPVNHPYGGTASYRCCLEWQVVEYIAYLMGEVKDFRPWLLKP